jgi:hypothetical protein
MKKSKLIQIAVLAAALAVMAAGQQNTNSASQQTNTNGAAKKSGSTENAKKPAAGNSASAGTKMPAVTVSKSGPAKTAPAPAPPPKTAGPAKAGPTVVVNQSAKQPASARKSSAVTGGGKTSVTKSAAAPTPKPTVKPVNKSASGSNQASNAATALEGSRGRRDPFVSVIKVQEGSPAGPVLPPCSSGKKCLSIPQIVLQGTVKDRDGKMIALVANGPRTYFLRENDQVFNGSVIRITTDSVIFRESVTDKLGHETSHEVVKRLTPAT